jgi:hypothetical protein
MYSTCIFNVPKTLNDGSKVSPEMRLEIMDELRRFGGWTVREVIGMWEGMVEESWEYEIDVLPERVDELRSVVESIGEKLGQEVMRFNPLPPTTQHIPIAKNRKPNS